MIDTAVAQLLTTASELPALQVRPSTEPVRVNDGVTRVLFTQIAGPRSYNSERSDGVIPATFQVDCYASPLSAARAIAAKIRTALDGFKGTQAETQILRIHFPNDRFTQAQRDAGANNVATRFSVDMVVTYRE